MVISPVIGQVSIAGGRCRTKTGCRDSLQGWDHLLGLHSGPGLPAGARTACKVGTACRDYMLVLGTI